MKKLLAYSSVSQIGYILLALSLNSNAGLFAEVLHMVNHSIIKISLFMVASCKSDTDNLEGLKKKSIPFAFNIKPSSNWCTTYWRLREQMVYNESY